MTEPSGDGSGEGFAGKPVADLRAFVGSMADRDRARLSPEEIRAQVQERVDEITGGLLSVQSETYRGSAGDDDQVVAEVNGNGKLVNVEISPYAMRDLDAAELSRACVDAIAAARKTLNTELRAALVRVTGQEPPEELPDPEEALREAEEKFRRENQ